MGCERGAAASDLAEAIERTREALTAVPRRGMEWVRQQHNLCLLLLRRFKVSGDNQDLDAAVRAGQAAVDGTPAAHPAGLTACTAWPRRMPSVTSTARTRTSWPGTGRGAAFREAALAGSAPARTRVDAAQSWGLLAAAAEDWADALSGYTEAVAALDTLAGTSRPPRWCRCCRRRPPWPVTRPLLRCTRRTPPAARLPPAGTTRPPGPRTVSPGRRSCCSSAAAGPCSPRPSRPPRTGPRWPRSLLTWPSGWASSRRGLDFPADVPGESTDPATAAQRAEEQRQELAGEWETLVRQARQRPGLEHVFARPGFAELSAAAADGPVVILNISGYRCDALIVTDGGLGTVPLDVTPGWVAKCADLLAAAVATQDGPGSRRGGAVRSSPKYSARCGTA